jgi:hypothetical protein
LAFTSALTPSDPTTLAVVPTPSPELLLPPTDVLLLTPPEPPIEAQTRPAAGRSCAL